MKKLSILLVLFILTAVFIFAQEENTEAAQSAVTSQPESSQGTNQQAAASRPASQQGTNQQQAEAESDRAIELLNVELSFNFPVHWTNGRHTDVFYQVNEPTPVYTLEDKFVTANTSIGIGLTFNFTRIFGLSMDFDIFFGTKLAGFSNPSSDYNSLFGINAFIGPVFYLFNNGILRIPLAVGAHLYYFEDDLWISEYGSSDGAWFNRTDLQFGPAVSFGIQFHFNNGIYVFSRTQLAIDIVRLHSIQTDNLTDQAIQERNHTDLLANINWGIKPSIGIGIRK